MSAEVERQVMAAVAQYTHRLKWKQWGMDKLRKQGSAILLEGPSGTGKTTIANYIALTIRRKGMHEISFADFGSHIPGENARQIRKIFEYAKENENMTLFFDDCEAVLQNRKTLDPTMKWMLEIVDEILVQIGRYEGLIIMATNLGESLDPAIERRIIARVKVDIPDYAGRLALWRTKMPEKFPLKLSLAETEVLAHFVATGAEIENAILLCASESLRLNREPKFTHMQKCIQMFAHE